MTLINGMARPYPGHYQQATTPSPRRLDDDSFFVNAIVRSKQTLPNLLKNLAIIPPTASCTYRATIGIMLIINIQVIRLPCICTHFAQPGMPSRQNSAV
jgi:hypothetical protein